jgi:hypothetical protein
VHNDSHFVRKITLIQRIPTWFRSSGVGLLVLLAGCSGASKTTGAIGDDPGFEGRDGGAPPTTNCEPFAVRECGIELGTFQGQTNCARGTQICENGTWGACAADPSKGTTSVPARSAQVGSADHFGTQAIGGTSTKCIDNPCDPYCQIFTDVPDAAITADRTVTTTGWQSGGTLAGSNNPPAFKDKGSLNAQCSNPVGSQSWNEACQFDQHCVGNACVAFGPTESGSCTGIDITAPTTCIPMTGFRDVTVCNRGTVAAPPGVKCYRYSGGSPQYPNDDPGVGAVIMTTATTIAPGTCETQQIPEAVFQQNGIQSVMCNPPAGGVNVVVSGPKYPASNGSVSGMVSWSSPANGYASDGVNATAAPPNPNGATTGPSFPAAAATFGSDGAWSNTANAYSDTPAGQYATASPAFPAMSSGTVGPNAPTSNVNPSSSSDGAWSNPTNGYASDSSYATAAPSNPGTSIVVTGAPSSDDGSTSWTNLNQGYTSDGLYTTSLLNDAGTNTASFGGFGFDSIPANAVLDSLTLTVKWKSTVNSSKYTLGVEAVTGASNTTIGSELVKPSPLTTETTDTLTVPAATLSAFTASDFTDANLRVKLRFTRSNGSVTDATASVDYVSVSLSYHLTSTTSSIAFGNFGLDSVPSGASVKMTVEVKWKTSTVNAYVTLGMQAYKEWGTANQAPIGAEVTRTPALANTDYVDSSAVLTPSAADLADGLFKVKIRVTRNDGAVNPDVTASIDYVRVSLTWSVGPPTTTHSVLLSQFGFDQVIPQNATITGVTTTAAWKLSTATTHATLGLQAYSGAGTVALGTETTNALGPIVDTTATQVVASGVSRSDLSDANFGVLVRVIRDSSTTANPDFTAYLDYVKVAVTWTSPSVSYAVTYGNFGFNALPSDAVITQIKTEANWRVSTSTSHAELGLQPYIGGGSVAVGTESVDSSPPTTATTQTQTLTGLSLSPSDLSDANFKIRVRATRTSGTNGGGNPDFTAYLDFVRVTITYDDPFDVSIPECNQANNWTATKLVPDPDPCSPMSTTTYTPFTVTRVFQAVCPAGTNPRWKQFGYTTSTPPSTKVEFRVRSFEPTNGSCTALAAVTTSPPAPLATASLTGDPEVCSLAGTGNPCPKSLYDGLGKLPAAAYGCLQMDAYGVPSTTAAPQLIDWTATYDCVPSQ